MTTMTRGLAEEVKRRAFRELRQRDEEGSFLDLNYRQKQAFNEKDVAAVRPILDQRLKRTKRTLWGMGLSIPIVLVLELYLELYWWPGSAGEGGVRGALGLAVSALWAMFFMGYALKVALPRIAAFERARALLELYEENASNSGPHQGVGATEEEIAA